LNVRHFRMVAVTGLNIMVSRSPSTEWPPYRIS